MKHLNNYRFAIYEISDAKQSTHHVQRILSDKPIHFTRNALLALNCIFILCKRRGNQLAMGYKTTYINMLTARINSRLDDPKTFVEGFNLSKRYPNKWKIKSVYLWHTYFHTTFNRFQI